MPALVKMVRLRGPCYFRGTRDLIAYTPSSFSSYFTIKLNLIVLFVHLLRPIDALLG